MSFSLITEMTDMTMSDCTEPNRAKCPRLCHDYCNKAETEKANRHCSDQFCSEIATDDWRTAFQEYEDACGDGFGENRIIMMQEFRYAWDMRTHKHSFQNR